jgi:Ribbon-helix-helix protein, copG family
MAASGALTYSHITNMVFHMKTTLNIDDTVMGRLRREAARQGKTMSELVEAALRLLFHDRTPKRKKLPPLPRFHGGKHLVDIADRTALYDVMEGRR